MYRPNYAPFHAFLLLLNHVFVFICSSSHKLESEFYLCTQTTKLIIVIFLLQLGFTGPPGAPGPVAMCEAGNYCNYCRNLF